MFKPLLVEQFGNSVLRRADVFLSSLPRRVMEVVVVLIQLLLLYAYYNLGPWVSPSLFFFLNFYLAAKYVGSEFAYVLAFMAAAGKTYIEIGYYPEDAPWWEAYWQFISSYAIYSLFCYFIHVLVVGRKSAEQALDRLSKLSEAVIAETDSAVLVLDELGEAVVTNPALVRMLAISPESLEDGRQVVARLPPVLRDAIHACSGNGEPYRQTVRVGGGEGEITAIASARRILFTDKYYVLLVLADISAYRAALHRARAAERQLVNIGEQVQQSIGRELHDDLGQHLAGAAFMAEVLRGKLQDAGRGEALDAAGLTAMMNEAVSKTRHLSQGLYPDELREHGLCNMMEKLAASTEAIHAVQCTCACSPAFATENAELHIHLFRIAQEAVSNSIRHGHAKHIALIVETDDKVRRLIVSDDGCGFGNATSSRKGVGLGMRTMQYRSDILGGSFKVDTPATGGTRITVEMPRQ